MRRLAALTVVRGRTTILPHGLLLAAIAVGLAANVIGPERFVAEANVARALDPSLVPPDGRRAWIRTTSPRSATTRCRS